MKKIKQINDGEEVRGMEKNMTVEFIETEIDLSALAHVIADKIKDLSQHEENAA